MEEMNRKLFDELRAEGWASPHENKANIFTSERWKTAFIEAEEKRIILLAEIERLRMELESK